MDQTGCACLVRLSDRHSFPLMERLTTIGSSRRSKIRIDNADIPSHCAYILFNKGSYFLHPVDNAFPVLCNGKLLEEPAELFTSSILEFSKETYLFEKNSHTSATKDGNSAVYKLVGAINAFFRNVNPEARFEMLNSISQVLKCDGARLVVEEQLTGSFTTIARFPQSSGLDRFSERALLWAKQKRKTVLMNASQWQSDKQQGSLELNNIGSILCMPIICNQAICGYLYLDRLDTQSPFTSEDWEICDAMAPIIGDLLAVYERASEQQKILDTLQKTHNGSSKPVLFSSKKMAEIIKTACNFARTDSTVLLLGETGSGKEVIARLVHKNSNRSLKPFLVINC
ncbi:MAG TPA: sigma 54-interacting transcriptional regulator [Chitinispirillaceae bacterium]|nr:sigma 54-interacting transcriptional regulator [Chitinispirillaceae bacterium]